jgi:hypothetical protein
VSEDEVIVTMRDGTVHAFSDPDPRRVAKMRAAFTAAARGGPSVVVDGARGTHVFRHEDIRSVE